jgi:hypothetical protein
MAGGRSELLNVFTVGAMLMRELSAGKDSAPILPD